MMWCWVVVLVLVLVVPVQSRVHGLYCIYFFGGVSTRHTGTRKWTGWDCGPCPSSPFCAMFHEVSQTGSQEEASYKPMCIFPIFPTLRAVSQVLGACKCFCSGSSCCRLDPVIQVAFLDISPFILHGWKQQIRITMWRSIFHGVNSTLWGVSWVECIFLGSWFLKSHWPRR